MLCRGGDTAPYSGGSWLGGLLGLLVGIGVGCAVLGVGGWVLEGLVGVLAVGGVLVWAAWVGVVGRWC